MLSERSLVVFATLVSCLFTTLKAQEEVDLPRELKDLMEAAAFEADRDDDYRGLTEDLLYFYHHSLDINQAGAEELSRLHLLTPFQVQSLLRYRRRYGRFLSIYELPLIFGFTPELVRKLKPFITTGSHAIHRHGKMPSPGEVIRKGRKQLMLRTGSILEKQKGFMKPLDSLHQSNPHQRYLGSPWRLYTQLSLKYHRRLRAGATLEKDPGETFFGKDNPYGFDYHSFHLFLKDIRGLDKLALGDYDIRLGQGLVAWSGFTFSKSSMVLSPIRHAPRIDPYTSANENGYFRGMALEKRISPVTVSLFYSNKRIDANLADSTENQYRVFTSFQRTGYHRISRELYDERAIREQIFGGSVAYNRSRLKVALNGMGYHYDGILRRAPRPENLYRFSGRRNANLSLDYQLALNRFYFFGEEALSTGEGPAFLNGIQGYLAPGLRMMLLHRYYERDYQALYSGAFSEGPRAQNEHGLYFGMEAEITGRLLFRSFLDRWRFPSISHRSDGPSTGWEVFTELEYTFKNQSVMYLRYQGEGFAGSRVEEHTGLIPWQEDKFKVRYHLRYQLNPDITLDHRMEYVSSEAGGKSQGLMLYQDIGYKPSRMPFRFDLRYALFDTDDYHSRIYAYEDDLLYVFSIPPYYSRGCRTYLNMKYTLGNLDLWMKIARTTYMDKDRIGSGLNEIAGRHKTTLYFQMRMRF
jgi:hypothetical protein